MWVCVHATYVYCGGQRSALAVFLHGSPSYFLSLYRNCLSLTGQIRTPKERPASALQCWDYRHSLPDLDFSWVLSSKLMLAQQAPCHTEPFPRPQNQGQEESWSEATSGSPDPFSLLPPGCSWSVSTTPFLSLCRALAVTTSWAPTKLWTSVGCVEVITQAARWCQECSSMPSPAWATTEL